MLLQPRLMSPLVLAVLGMVFLCAANLLAQAPPANLVTYYNDPPEVVTTNVANGVTEFVLYKELGSYPNYGVADGAANILYTGEAATWHFNLPASVNPAAISTAFVRASLIADDHYAVSLNTYSLAAWTNGVYLGDSIAGLPHGSPFGSRFNNWQQRDFTIRYPSAPFSLTLFNTSGVGNWFAIDWIELHIFVQSNAAPIVLTSANPSQVGNTGPVTISLTGLHLPLGARAATLLGVGTLQSTALEQPDSAHIITHFDLTNAEPGFRDIAVTFSDGSSVSLLRAVAIVAGGGPSLTGTVLGPSAVRFRRDTTFYGIVRNDGLVDADFVTLELSTDQPHTSQQSTTSLEGFSSASLQAASLGCSVSQIPPLVRNFSLGSGSILSIPITVNCPANMCSTVRTKVKRVRPGSLTCEQLAAQANAVRAGIEGLYAWRVNNLAGLLGNVNSCYNPYNPARATVCQTALDLDEFGIKPAIDNAKHLHDVLKFQAQAAGCTANFDLPHVADALDVLMDTIVAEVKRLRDAQKTLYDSNAGTEMSNFLSSLRVQPPVQYPRIQTLSQLLFDEFEFDQQFCTVTSWDPNDKIGPSGVGTGHYLSGNNPLDYDIHFENQANATAPAASVVVQDPLPQYLDPSTVVFTGVRFGATAAVIQESAGSFTTTVDLRPAKSLLVEVDANVNVATGLITVNFTSLDPATTKPVTDALTGFLPPNQNPPEGEGAVSFTIGLRPGVATNTQVVNQGMITFDANPPISTPAWTNTIDSTAPISRVSTLAMSQTQAAFVVQWSGSDVGVGIGGYDVYVSDNSGPFALWLPNTNATSSQYRGANGHTYRFYSIARDLVGNVEAAKSAAEATTRVGTDTIPPITTAVPSPAPNAAGWNNTNVTITLSSTDNEPGGTGVKQIQWSLTAAQTGSTTVPGSTTTVTVSTEGTTTLTYFGTDNAGNVEEPKTITVRIDKTPSTILGTRTPGPNVNGWNNTPVAVNFQCADNLSGLAVGSPPLPTLLSTEGAGQSVTRTCTDMAGNSATATVSGINIDVTPPILTVALNPPPNANGWNSTNVTVSWAAVDALSGVSTVSAPISVTAEGAGQVVNGSATDLAGNLATGSVRVNVDKTAPEAFIQFDPASKDVVLFGRDSLSGVVPGPVTPISIQPVRDRDEGDDQEDQRVEIRTYRIIDLAGNSLLLIERVQRQEDRVTARLLSLQYNNGTVITLPENKETFEWDLAENGSLRELHQQFTESLAQDSQNWDAEYESERNSTTIERESPKPEQNVVVPGLDLLRLATNSGRLAIEY